MSSRVILARLLMSALGAPRVSGLGAMDSPSSDTRTRTGIESSARPGIGAQGVPTDLVIDSTFQRSDEEPRRLKSRALTTPWGGTDYGLTNFAPDAQPDSGFPSAIEFIGTSRASFQIHDTLRKLSDITFEGLALPSLIGSQSFLTDVVPIDRTARMQHKPWYQMRIT